MGALHLSLNTALKIELSLAVGSHSTPSRLISNLSIVTNGSRLPGLIERLKVEAVEAPIEQGTEAGLVEVLSVVQSAFGLIVIGANSRGPAGFAGPDLGGFGTAAGYFLDVCGRLEHVVEVDVAADMLVYGYIDGHGKCVRSVIAAGALPEGKSVDHDDIGGADDSITGSVGELVPRVCGSNLDARGQLRLDSLDLTGELLASEVAAVERLGADGDGVDGVGVLLGNVGDGLEVLVEGLLDIGPVVSQLVYLVVIFEVSGGLKLTRYPERP